jgi:hypothetical protein
MPVLLIEFPFTLSFDQTELIVPFDVGDPQAFIERAYCKIGADAAGKKEFIGCLLVRDRRMELRGAPLVKTARVFRQMGPVVELPDAVGTLVGSFVSHSGQHTWHVFEKRAPAPAKSTPQSDASPVPSRSENGVSRFSGPATAEPVARGPEF